MGLGLGRGLALTLAFGLVLLLAQVPEARAAGLPLGAADPVHEALTLREARLVSRTGTAAVALPHVLGPQDFRAEGDRVRYTLSLQLPRVPQEPLGVFITKVSLSGQLYLNGQLIGGCAEGALEVLRCLHRPWLVSTPAALWKQGENQLSVEVYADGRQTNGLSAVRVGPLPQLAASDYAAPYFLRVQLMQGLSWVTVILGLLSLMVAFYLRSRSLYLWVGLASLAHALSNINFLATQALPTAEVFGWFAFSSRMASVPLLMLACIAFYRRDRPWHHALALGYALAGPLLVWLADSDRWVISLYYLPVLACGVLVLIAMARWTWQSRTPAHLLMLAAVTAMTWAGYGDWMRLRGSSAFEGTYLMAYASAGFLAIMGSLVMAELAAGLLKSRELTATLEQKVAEREQRLAEAYEQRLQVERTAASTQERERLLADMHDSLGAGLSTAHLLLRQGQLTAAGAAHVVQECMDDLRLVFDVSANLEEDLVSLLADVRYRLDGRMAAVDLQTRWDIEAEGMPSLGPSGSLQLMRILQEAITNVLRHARARHLQVTLRWQPASRQLLMRVQDDGQGIPATFNRSGRGFGNMARRAAMLGGELDIRPAEPGTVVEFRLQR